MRKILIEEKDRNKMRETLTFKLAILRLSLRQLKEMLLRKKYHETENKISRLKNNPEKLFFN